MDIKKILVLANEQERKDYAQLCRDAKKVEIDRTWMTERLRFLFRLWLERSGKDDSKISALIEEFWKKFQDSSEKKEKIKKEEKIDDFQDLDRLTQELPYPLSFRLHEFVEESKFFLQKKGSTNYAFLLASMNGLALRFHAIVALCVYVHFLNAPDTSLNQEIIEGLQLPADGTWKTFLDQILREEQCHLHPWLQVQREMLYTRMPFIGRKKGLAPIVAMQEMVQFRNHLLHGSHRFSREEIQEAMQKIQLIFTAMKPWSEAKLEAISEERILSLRGFIPFIKESEIKEKDSLEKASTIVYRSSSKKDKRKEVSRQQTSFLFFSFSKETEQKCPLYPLLCFVDKNERASFEKEVFFFNGSHHDQSEYISYRYPRSQDHHALGVPFHDVIKFLKSFHAVRLQPKVRIDYFELTRTHLQAFVGREKQLQALYRFLAERPSPYGVVYGRGGMGKTTLFARMYQAYQKEEKVWPKDLIGLWHFCGSIDGRDHAIVFWRSVLAQLEWQLDGQEGYYPHALEPLQKVWQTRLQDAATQGKRVVLIVDGIDEGHSFSIPLFSIPTHLPTIEQIPNHLTVLCSYRADDESGQQSIEELLPIPVDALHRIEDASPLRGLDWAEMVQMLSLHLREITQYPDTLLAIWGMATHTLHSYEQTAKQHLLTEIQSDAQVSQQDRLEQQQAHIDQKRWTEQKNSEAGEYADPLLLRFLYEELQEGRIDPKRAESVPKSLQMIFDRTWNQLAIDDGYLLIRILGMLSVMPDAGSDAFFSSIFEEERKRKRRSGRVFFPEDVAKKRIFINRWLTFRKDQYTIFHRRFREYVRQHFHLRDQETALHEPIYRYCLSDEGRFQTYDLLYRIHHLSWLARSKRAHVFEKWRQEMLALLHEEKGFFVKKWEMFQRVDLLQEDFLSIIRCFSPNRESSISKNWSDFSKVYFLCLHSYEMLLELQQQRRYSMEELAKKGKQEQLLQWLLEEKSEEKRLWIGLQSCFWLAHAGHSFRAVWQFLFSLSPVFLAVGERGSIRQMLEQLPISQTEIEELFQHWYTAKADQTYPDHPIPLVALK